MQDFILNDTNNTVTSKTQTSTGEIFLLDVTQIAPALKHSTIFKYFDALQPGELFEIINDHDPKPLYYQLIAQRGSIFSWEYVEDGPEIWRVQIKKNEKNTGLTVGEIAAKDLRKADVFKKLGIDFCCGGKKSLQQACDENGLAIDDVELALNNAQQNAPGHMNFNSWQPGFLADYIFNQHHQYYYSEEPVISDLMAKVFEKHGASHSDLAKLNSLYTTLKNELDTHFKKEEVVVFPFIKSLEKAMIEGKNVPIQPSLSDPIHMMESDHDGAGELLREIRNVTNNYTPYDGACNSVQLLFNKLKDLEEDLHQHIHLENNILFPKALDLESQVNITTANLRSN